MIITISFLGNSCRQSEKQHDDYDPYAPKVVQAKGHVLPVDSFVPPKVTTVHNVKSITAGKPKVISLVNNIHPAGKPKIVLAGTPKENTPGQNGFRLPAVAPAAGKPFTAGVPEVVLAKDAFIKDDNPDNFSAFKILQGLKQPLIRSMMQDRTGNLWFGTYSGGVSKYDGKFFTNYTTAQGLSNDGVWSMLQDKQGNIWLGTSGGGVCKYDGHFFTNYSTKEGLPNKSVFSIIEDKAGHLWFGGLGGVTEYDGKSFANYKTAQGLKNDLVHGILQDKAGNIWFCTQGGGASKYDGKSFMNYTAAEGMGDDVVNCMLEDKAGDLWFGTNGGITKYDGKYFSTYTSAEGLNDNIIISILEDKTGNLWFGSFGGGICKYDGKSFTHFTTTQGLSNNKVPAILEDKAGILWFGTNGGGVSRYDGRSFTHFTTVQGLAHNEVMRTVEDKSGNLWFATWGGGVSKYDGKSFSNYTVAEGLSNNNVFSILLDKAGNLWFGTGHGVSEFDGKSFTNYTADQGLTNFEIWSMLQDKAGNIWIGSFGDGVYKFDGKSFMRFVTTPDLGDGTIMFIQQDKIGNIWIGNYGGGVTVYDGKTFTYYTTAGGVSSNEVMDMLIDKNNTIWIGTIGGGINKFDGKSFTYYNSSQGLSNNIVMGILEDKTGNLWFSTRNGLNRMISTNVSSSSNPGGIGTEKTKSHNQSLFKNYQFADGFLGVNGYVNSIFEDSKSKIWIGTGDRLTCYNPEGEIPDSIPPNIQLSNIALFNENINWVDLEKRKDTTLILGNGVKIGDFEFDGLSKFYNIPENLKLKYNNNYLTFKFIGITTRSPYKVNYQYKLEGLDENWNDITDRTEAPYGNLPFGSYTFKVKAMNSEGYWSNTLSYAFVIYPPWWKTWWFRTTLFASLALLLYSFYRYRLNQVLHLQSIRNKIASDLHDDIGSTLNSISVYSEVARQDESKHAQALEMIGESSRKIIDAMSDIVWTINPKNDHFEQIILRLRSLTYNLLKAKNIEHTFRADESVNHIRLSMEERRNFYLIFKEALNNMVKYSNASRASISLIREHNFITLHIRDNGVGFDSKQFSTGNGLLNMKYRAEEMKAMLTIESDGNGTGIQLKIKV